MRARFAQGSAEAVGKDVPHQGGASFAQGSRKLPRKPKSQFDDYCLTLLTVRGIRPHICEHSQSKSDCAPGFPIARAGTRVLNVMRWSLQVLQSYEWHYRYSCVDFSAVEVLMECFPKRSTIFRARFAQAARKLRASSFLKSGPRCYIRGPRGTGPGVILEDPGVRAPGLY